MHPHSIEFHGPVNLPFPQPYPAIRNVPDWFKDMPAETWVASHGKVLLTVKRCPPFVDALTGGYIIPLADDVHFTLHEDGVNFSSTSELVRTHPREQLPKELAGRVIVKFLNPWIIKTPPGSSCLFVQPLNRFNLPFQILSGIIETDTYYQGVNFPAICLMRPGSRVEMKKGTPLVQVFPFTREPWESSVHPLEAERWKQQVDEMRGTTG